MTRTSGFGTGHALAGLLGLLATLYFYELMLPGSLANAQYALGDAAFAQCIANTGNPFLCTSFGYPAGSTKPFGLPVSLLALAFSGLDGQVGLMDVRWAHITILAVAYCGACVFFSRVALSPWLGMAGALLYLVSPAIVLQSSYGALQLGMALLPAYLLVDSLLLSASRGGGLWRILLALAMVAGVRTWALYLDGYSFLFSGLLAGCWFIASGLARRDWPRVGLALGAYALACGMATVAYRTYISGDALQGMSMAFYRAAGVDLVTLFLPPGTHPVYSHLSVGHQVTAAMTWSDGSGLMGTFVGYVSLIAVAVVAGVAWRRRRLPPPLLLSVVLAGLVGLVLSLGPSLKVGDFRPSDAAVYSMPREAATVDLPTAKVYTSVPGVRNARVLARWLVVTRLALVSLVVFAAACLLRLRFGPVMAAGLLALAFLETLPDPMKPADKGPRVYAHAHWIYNDLSSDFARGMDAGEQVYLAQVHDAPGGNEYVVNTLCARADVRCYNAGGDKASIMVREFWPGQILRAKQGRDIAGNLSSALDQGLVDVVVVPYFDLRSVVYGIRQGEVRVDQVRERANALAVALDAGIEHAAHFSFIRRDGAPRRPRAGLVGAGDPDPADRFRIHPASVDDVLATMPLDPESPLSIFPARLDGCAPSGARTSVTVWWNVAPSGVGRVQLRVSDSIDAPTKLWTSGGATGRRQTGAWIREGSVIELRDRDDGGLLRRVVVENAPCRMPPVNANR